MHKKQKNEYLKYFKSGQIPLVPHDDELASDDIDIVSGMFFGFPPWAGIVNQAQRVIADTFLPTYPGYYRTETDHFVRFPESDRYDLELARKICELDHDILLLEHLQSEKLKGKYIGLERLAA